MQSPQHLLEMSLENQHIEGCYGNWNPRVYNITVINVIQTLLIFQHHSCSLKEQQFWFSRDFFNSGICYSFSSHFILFLNGSYSGFALEKLVIVSIPLLIVFWLLFCIKQSKIEERDYS